MKTHIAAALLGTGVIAALGAGALATAPASAQIPFRVIEAAELVTNNAAVTANSPGVLTFQGGGKWVHCPTATIPPSVLKQVRMDLEIR